MQHNLIKYIINNNLKDLAKLFRVPMNIIKIKINPLATHNQFPYLISRQVSSILNLEDLVLQIHPWLVNKTFSQLHQAHLMHNNNHWSRPNHQVYPKISKFYCLDSLCSVLNNTLTWFQIIDHQSISALVSLLNKDFMLDDIFAFYPYINLLKI